MKSFDWTRGFRTPAHYGVTNISLNYLVHTERVEVGVYTFKYSVVVCSNVLEASLVKARFAL